MLKILFGAVLFVSSALAADVSGIWSGAFMDRNGDPQDFSFRFAQKGETLTGKMYGDNESTAIASPKISGNQISFTVTTELNGQVTTSLYTATVNGDQMDVSRVRLDSKTAKPSDPQIFKLKRLT